jgi:hypothetical protein
VPVLSLTVDQAFESVAVVSPCVDGVPLAELARRFESARKYSPAGGYGGLIPDYFNFGDLTKYFLGRAERQFPGPGRVYVLGCVDCGEVGCWPLDAAIVVSDDAVTWARFRQPHRPERGYRAFGPFVFDRRQYQEAVQSAVEAFAAHSDWPAHLPWSGWSVCLWDVAWRDTYGEITPPEAVIDDVFVMAAGDLCQLVGAAHLAVTDWRDLRVGADQMRDLS